MKPTYRKSWAGNLLMCSDLTLGPLLQGETMIAILESAYICLIIVSRMKVGILRIQYGHTAAPTEISFRTL